MVQIVAVQRLRMPRRPQPVELKFLLAKPLYQYVVRRAERDFETLQQTCHRIVLEAMQNDPVEREAVAAQAAVQAQAAKLATKEAAREAKEAARAQAAEARAQAAAEREALRAKTSAEREALRAQVVAEKLAKKAERLSPNVEISDEEIYEARQLINKFPPTLVHGKSSTGYKGVEQYNHKYRASFTLMGNRRHLGVFEKPADAARAYDAMCRRVYGKRALLNFPNHLELSAKDGRQRVVVDGKEGWQPAPSPSLFPMPKPIPNLPPMVIRMVPNEQGFLHEPPGERARLEQERMRVIIEHLQKEAQEAGMEWDDSVQDPAADAAEEERLRRAAMIEPPGYHEEKAVVHVADEPPEPKYELIHIPFDDDGADAEHGEDPDAKH